MKSTKKSSKQIRIINFSPAYRAASAIFYQVVFFLALIFNTLFYRLQIIGRNNLHLEKALLVSNHSMYLDPATIAQALFPRRTHYTVLEETFSIPILGGMIRLLGAFPLPKGNTMKLLLGPMKKALDETGFIHFFPEGKLYPNNTSIKEFKEGVCFFSIRYKIPVVPLTIIVRRKRKKKSGNYLLPPKVRIVIGKPVYPEAYMKNDSLRNAMKSMADDLRRTMQKTINGYIK